MTIKTKAYLHSSKEQIYDIGEELGLTEEQMQNFKYALYEVMFDLEVDHKGNAKIVAVDGRKLNDTKS